MFIFLDQTYLSPSLPWVRREFAILPYRGGQRRGFGFCQRENQNLSPALSFRRE
jgi:hypothetical protein